LVPLYRGPRCSLLKSFRVCFVISSAFCLVCLILVCLFLEIVFPTLVGCADCSALPSFLPRGCQSTFFCSGFFA